jgi:hypothetical protein
MQHVTWNGGITSTMSLFTGMPPSTEEVTPNKKTSRVNGRKKQKK